MYTTVAVQVKCFMTVYIHCCHLGLCSCDWWGCSEFLSWKSDEKGLFQLKIPTQIEATIKTWDSVSCSVLELKKSLGWEHLHKLKEVQFLSFQAPNKTSYFYFILYSPRLPPTLWRSFSKMILLQYKQFLLWSVNKCAVSELLIALCGWRLGCYECVFVTLNHCLKTVLTSMKSSPLKRTSHLKKSKTYWIFC